MQKEYTIVVPTKIDVKVRASSIEEAQIKAHEYTKNKLAKLNVRAERMIGFSVHSSFSEKLGNYFDIKA